MKSPLAVEAQRWFLEAKADLDTARYLQRGKRFNTACFQAQQSAEKATKAFLFACGSETPWGHSVGDLLRKASSFESGLGKLRILGHRLDKFYVPTRYPNGLPGGIPSEAYTKDDASEAISLAQDILKTIEKLLRKRKIRLSD